MSNEQTNEKTPNTGSNTTQHAIYSVEKLGPDGYYWVDYNEKPSDWNEDGWETESFEDEQDDEEIDDDFDSHNGSVININGVDF